MILNFLQTRNPPVLPCLHKRPHQRLHASDGKLSAFADDLDSLRGFGKKNQETLGELLFHFFRRYAYEIDYEKNVVSVREGQLISKEGKRWHLMQNNRLCVEEPFNTERNLGNTADDISFRGLHLEIRRAFGLISEARLLACTEQYEYPAAEERIWEKPPVKPPPILTRSHSQSGRGGKTSAVNRAGRNGQPQSRGHSGRRASNPATVARLNGVQYGPRGFNPRDNALPNHYDQLQLHERIVNEFQLLQAQEHQLRMIQAQAQLDQAHAQAHAHAHAQNAIVQQSAREMFGRSSGMNPAPPPPLTAPIRHSPLFYPFPYQQPNGGDPNYSVHTNPSSPSMKPVQPMQPELRRRVDRSSAVDSAASASRSHSQPARPLPLALPIQNPSTYPMRAAAFQQYQQARQQQLYNALEMAQRNQRYPENHNPRPIASDHSYEECLPKEYVGYYVHDSSPAHPYRDMPVTSQVPPYNDLQHFRPPRPDFHRLRNAPRSPSPSPSMPYRDRSQSVRSSASAPSGPVPLDRTPNHSSSLRNTGPVIVDGAETWDFGDYVTTSDTPTMSQTSTMSSINTSQDDRYPYHNPYGIATFPAHRQVDPGIENLHRQPQGYTGPELPRPADLFRNTRAEQALRSQVPQINGINPSETPSRSRNDSSHGMNGLGIQYDDRKIKVNAPSPANSSIPIVPRQVKQNGPLDSKADEPSQAIDNTPKPVPLLSPVREVRSPSPRALLKRREGIPEQKKPVIFNGPLNLEIPPFSPERYEKRKQKEALAQKPNGKVMSPPAKVADTSSFVTSPVKERTPPPQINGWQQTIRKGKKKGKGHSGQISVDMTGEPIPVDEADRKGG